MRLKFCSVLPMLLLALATAGCGGFVARRMVQSPNTYPAWFAGKARVELAFKQNFLTNFPARFVEVGPPSARLRYRIVEPADYHSQLSATNWLQHGHAYSAFTLAAAMPGRSNAWTSSPRGTVVLLHGYGLSQFAMAPWALRLAEAGWRCVLVDLRGHGKSTGRRIYYGLEETHDLSQLLDELAREGQGTAPVAVVGHSYGAALALRWKAADPRIGNVVAMAPYAVLSNAVLNICHDYSGWLPRGLVKAGLRHLPSVLKVDPAELDPATVLARSPVVALFVAGENDIIAPTADVKRLFAAAAPGSELVLVPEATHEAVTYYFNELVPPALRWLDGKGGGPRAEGRGPKSE